MILIEKLKLDDVLETKNLLKITWNDTYKKWLSPKTIQKVTSHWHKTAALIAQANDPNVYFAIAKTETNKIVGLVTLKKIDDKTTFLNRLYIHPNHQRKGLGSQLFAKAMQAFPGTKRVQIEVEELNKNAIRFYSKLGFTEIERKEDKVLDEVMDVIVMEREVF
jgi:ribosomal protein S18 acetylase RimI-like enzyme